MLNPARKQIQHSINNSPKHSNLHLTVEDCMYKLVDNSSIWSVDTELWDFIQTNGELSNQTKINVCYEISVDTLQSFINPLVRGDYDKSEYYNNVKSYQDCILETPLAEVYVDGVSIGLHNEYTIRKMQIAVKRKDINNEIAIVYKGQTSFICNNGKIKPILPKGFYDLSSDLALDLLDY